jgi:putative DNA primase/helicase
MGELDGTFRKSDMARLKQFVTSDVDEVRPPYAETSSKMQRRTVFAASVNDDTFLKDPTGNSRFWVLPVVDINYAHDIDMLQLWLQVEQLFIEGHSFALTKNEDRQLALHNRRHEDIDPVQETLLTFYNWDAPFEQWTSEKSATQIAEETGLKRTEKNASRRVGKALKWGGIGRYRILKGVKKWKIPPISGLSFDE